MTIEIEFAVTINNSYLVRIKIRMYKAVKEEKVFIK